MDGGGLKGTGTASIRVKDINDMPPSFTKDEWITEVDETDGSLLPDAPILTVTVHDEDESNKFHYKVIESSGKLILLFLIKKLILFIIQNFSKVLERTSLQWYVTMTEQDRSRLFSLLITKINCRGKGLDSEFRSERKYLLRYPMDRIEYFFTCR